MNPDKEYFQKVLRLCFIILAIFAFIGLAERIRQQLQPNDSSAIFGGKLESGYSFSGYFVSDKGGGNLEICGMVLINSTTAVTAAHCADDNTPMYIGLGDFSNNPNNYYLVKSANILPAWAANNPISADIAVLTIDTPVTLTEYAQIATADESCNYTVVGYGKQDNGDNYYPLRKSATLCINSTDFSDGSISFTGSDGGLCFGDSGSPIFKTGTNQFVTIASRIDSCYTKNFGTGADLSEQIAKFNLGASNNTNQASGDICGGIDADNNNLIDSVDLNVFISFYNQDKVCTDGGNKYSCGARDSNNDGRIDLIDLSSFALKYLTGQCS